MVNETELRKQIATARTGVETRRQQLKQQTQQIRTFKKAVQTKPSETVLRSQTLQDRFSRQKQRVSALKAAGVATKSIKTEQEALKVTEKQIRGVESELDAFQKARAKALARSKRAAKQRKELFRQIAVQERLRGVGGGTILKPKQFRELERLSKSLDAGERARALRQLRGVADVKGTEKEILKLSKDFPKLFASQKEFPLADVPKGFAKSTVAITFKEEVKKKGLATTILERAGKFAEEAVAERQKFEKIRIETLKKRLEPVLVKGKLGELIIGKQKTEAELAGERASRKFIAETAPFFVPGAGQVLAAVVGTEALVTPQGRERIRLSKDFLKEKNFPESLAYVPPVALGVGGSFGIRSHQRALSQISKISKESPIVKTSIASQNVRDKQIKKIITSLDPDVRLKLNANKLTAGRVYKTNIGEGAKQRTITFLEFGKGIKAEEGIEAGRRLYGVELDKAGNVVRQIGGFSIEKTNLEGTTRAITSLVIRSRQKRRLLGTKERNEFIQFTELTKSKVTKVDDITKVTTKTGVALVTKKKLKGKIDPSELVPSPEEARKVRAFFEGKAPGAGEPFAEVTGKAITIPKDILIKVKPAAGVITKDIKRLEVGEAIAIKPVLLSVEKIKGSVKTTERLVQFRKKLSPKARGEFDKLTKIEKLFLEGQVRVSKVSPGTGLSIKEVKKKLIVKTEKELVGGEVGLKAPVQITKTKVTPTVIPSEFAGKGLAPSGIPGAVGLLPPAAGKFTSPLLIKAAAAVGPALKTAAVLGQELGARVDLAAASKSAQILALQPQQSSLLASSQRVALEISTAQAPGFFLNFDLVSGSPRPGNGTGTKLPGIVIFGVDLVDCNRCRT